MTTESISVPRSAPIGTRVDQVSLKDRVKQRVKKEAMWFGFLYLLPPVLSFIGKRYPLRDRAALWVNKKLEERGKEPMELLKEKVGVENLKELPDFLGNMHSVAKLKFMISFGAPHIREFRRSIRKKGTIFSVAP